MEERKGFKSTFGFLMAAVGSAVGLGNIWGSLIAAAALTILPEALREFSDYRMLVYSIVLIAIMLLNASPRFNELRGRFTIKNIVAKLKKDKQLQTADTAGGESK